MKPGLEQVGESGGDKPGVEFEDFGLQIGDRWILEGISLRLGGGRMSALLGPKGSGKSTLLRSVVGLEGFTGRVRRRRGGITIDGEGAAGDPAALRRRRRRLVLVPASAAPFALSVEENVAAACHGDGLGRRQRREWIGHCLERCGLDHLPLKGRALALSQGERRFLCLARALAARPQALLLDEPFDGLDPYETGAMAQLLASLGRDHTIVLASQHVERAAAISEFLALFIQGRLIEAGPAAELLSSPRDPRTEAYLTGRPLRQPTS